MTEECVVAPDVALTVTLNVPGGVPVVVCGGLEPPPQETMKRSASKPTAEAITRVTGFLRRAEPPSRIIPTNPKLLIAARVAPPSGCEEATERAVVEIVSVVLVALPLGVSVGGLKVQLEAAGNPAQAKLTVPVKPPWGVMEMVKVAACPAATVALPLGTPT